jgi:hypothetical protein
MLTTEVMIAEQSKGNNGAGTGNGMGGMGM